MESIPYATIVASGDDAFDFLQAQLAADLRDIGGEPVLAAWCNPKGRVICLFRVSRPGENFLLTLPGELAEDVARRLAMFRFRAKVEFEPTAATAEQLGMHSGYESWRLDNLQNGIPEVLAAQSEQFTPHMLNLDLLGAVSVSKGCYPGQEIVARTHFRGATRRRTLRFECAQPVRPGDKVSDGQRDVGEVLNAIGNELLAVVPVDAAGGQLNVNDHALVNLPLPYSIEQEQTGDRR